MGKFIIKHIDNRKPQIKNTRHFVSEVKVEDTPQVEANSENVSKQVVNNKKKVKNEVMTTSEKIAMAQEVLEGAVNTKRLKRDKGLIERTESSKTILTEDNKELLND